MAKKEICTDKALLDFAMPADYDTVSEFLDIFAERYDFISIQSIGETILGRRIQMVTLGDEAAPKSIMYVGTHHGMEWITTLFLLRFINEYCEYYKSGKQAFGINLGTLFVTRRICVIPMLNVDGAELQIHGVDEKNPLRERLERMSGGDFSKWQANARGVDLNHNYNAGFAEYKKLEAERNIFAGPTRFSGENPESEPETGALCNYIRFSDDLRMILTLHTQGEEIYYTSGGYAPPGAKQIAAQLGRLSGYAVSEPEGLASYGGLTDWFIKEFGRPSFTIECGKGENPLPESRYFNIYAGLREMLFCAPLLI